MRITNVLPVILLMSACAPSLSQQVASVGSLARVQGLPSLKEGEVDPSTASGVAHLLNRPIDADIAVRIALLNNRELRARLRELGMPASELITAGTVANPTFEFELLPELDSQYELRVEYELTSLLMAPLRRSAAKDELEAARLATASDVVQLGYDGNRFGAPWPRGETLGALARGVGDHGSWSIHNTLK